LGLVTIKAEPASLNLLGFWAADLTTVPPNLFGGVFTYISGVEATGFQHSLGCGFETRTFSSYAIWRLWLARDTLYCLTMSTRSTVVYGDKFHFYTEAFDGKNVYLELENVEFEVSPNRVMVQIPAEVWLRIRQAEVFQLEFAKMTKAELLEWVTRAVDERITSHQQNPKNLLGLMGSGVFGGVNDARGVQIQAGLAYYQNVQNEQKEILKNWKP
jgi:hypothetical protein